MTTSGLTTRPDQLDMLGQLADASAAALAALLAQAGFEREGQLINHPQSGVTVAVPTDCAGYRITFPQASARNGLGIVDLPVAATYGVVQHVALALHAQDGAEDFPPAAEQTTTEFGDSLRSLATLVDQHPNFANLFDDESLKVHRFGEEAADLDRFAETIGGTLRTGSDGKYTHVEAKVGCLTFGLQADTADYQQARAERREKLLAEVKHWSETPFAHDRPAVELHYMRDTCWCLPVRGECGQLTHHNEDGSEPQFAATDADPITRDGYTTEDHR